MLTRDIRDLEYVVFDIETTGFDPKKNQIIEIGAVKVSGEGKVIDKFQCFVSLYMEKSLPKKIVELTSITDQILKDQGQDIKSVMNKFYRFFRGSILVAQNAKFDMSFIDEYYLNQDKLFLDNLAFDTIDLAKHIYPGKDTYKLAKLIEYFEIEYDESAHHRADYDAYLTAQIFVKGMKGLVDDNKTKINDFYDIFNIQEATLNQKRYLHSLLKQKNIILENKVYLSKFNASRQISILSKN